ncbi:MAG: DUF6273 domain-containing protein [Saccharofermentans sp.]|nr:DUF6273 domain-containing protein [Saccharofermentans sp.]
MNYKDSATKAAECVFQKQKAGLTNVTVGSTIKFGLYEQDYDTGKEEIEWIVLAVDGDKALIISKHVLAGQPYNRTQTDITWEECSLRTWLNETFYNDAFSADHQEMIISSTVSADENPTFSVDPGNSTTDKVFLLSISDVNEYFGSDSDRRCSGTTCLGNTGYYWWLLRSPGSQAYHVSIVEGFSKNYFYYISGNVNSFGINVDTPCGVRPAMWINLES